MQKLFGFFILTFYFSSLEAQVMHQDGQIMQQQPLPKEKANPNYIQVDSTVYQRVESQVIDNPAMEIEGYERELPQKSKKIIPKAPVLAKDQISIEYGAFSVRHTKSLIKSDSIIPAGQLFEINQSETGVKAFPLNFVFKYENESWGTAAFLDLNNQNSLKGLWYTKVSDNFKIGFSPDFHYLKETQELTVAGNKDSVSTKQHQLGLSLYMAFEVVNSDEISFEFYNYLGGVWGNRKFDSDAELNTYGFRIAPGFDVYFKTRKQLHFGFGLSSDFTFWRGSIEEVNGPGSFDVSGDDIDIRLDLLKMKILF